MDVQEWCRVLETTFLQYEWSKHAKKYTYTERTEVNPKHIEKIVRAYSEGNNPLIKELDGKKPYNKRILHLIPQIPILITVVIDKRNSLWKIVTYYTDDREKSIKNKFGNYDNIAN